MKLENYQRMIDLEQERDLLEGYLSLETELNNTGKVTAYEWELHEKIVKINREIHGLDWLTKHQHKQNPLILAGFLLSTTFTTHTKKPPFTVALSLAWLTGQPNNKNAVYPYKLITTKANIIAILIIVFIVLTCIKIPCLLYCIRFVW